MRRLLLALVLVGLATPALAVDTGTVTLDQAAPTWGDTVTFTVTTAGKLAAHERIYVTVVCVQSTVVFQFSTRAALGYAVPLEQQAGLAQLGLLIDTSEPGDCSATLISRIDRRHAEDTIIWLDVETFTVGAAA